MSQIENLKLASELDQADYVASSSEVAANSEAQDYRRLRDELRRAEMRLDIAFSGAVVAKLFLRNNWLQSCAVELSTAPEFNDQGGYYTSYSARVCEVEVIPQFPLPEELQDAETGGLDEDTAIAALEEVLDGIEQDLGRPFLEADSEDSYTMRVTRSQLQALLVDDQVSGFAAAALLWPDRIGSWGSEKAQPNDQQGTLWT